MFLGLTVSTLLWTLFAVIIGTFLVLDLGVLNKSDHKISTASAIKQSLFWVCLAMVFCVVIYNFYDPPGDVTKTQIAVDFLTAYFVEYALSVDNIFVIIVILHYFKVEEKYYHKVLFWGIFGALAMRAIFIFIGALLIAKFKFLLYLFGAFLLITGIKMLIPQKDEDAKLNFDKNPVMRFARKYFHFTDAPHEGRFQIKHNGKRYFTQLFLVILIIESTDLIFAVDSIPAAFAITQDRMVLYTSNIFAVLGLRAMFFMLAGILDRFHLLSKALALVLMFIGTKMFLSIVHSNEVVRAFCIDAPILSWVVKASDTMHHYPLISLSVIVALLFGSIILSMIFPAKEKKDSVENEAGNPELEIEGDKY